MCSPSWIVPECTLVRSGHWLTLITRISLFEAVALIHLETDLNGVKQMQLCFTELLAHLVNLIGSNIKTYRPDGNRMIETIEYRWVGLRTDQNKIHWLGLSASLLVEESGCHKYSLIRGTIKPVKQSRNYGRLLFRFVSKSN